LATNPSSPQSVDPKLLQQLYDRVDKLETKLLTASENGLFQKQPKITYDAIMAELAKALPASLSKTLTPQDYTAALVSLDTAHRMYDEAIEAAGLSNRLLYVYCAPVLVYLLAMLGAIIYLALKLLPAPAGSFLTIPINILLSGTVGAILRGITRLWTRINQMEYRKVWGAWFLLAPVMGALLGGVVYLGFFLGVVVTTLKTSITNPALGILIAFVAGYNWEWAQSVIGKITQILSGETKETKV
jgi:hypothetical protein